MRHLGAGAFGRCQAHVELGLDPAALQALAHGLELARQRMRLGSAEHRVPDRVGADREALQRLFQAVDHGGVVGLELIARVDQHQAAPGRRRQQRLEALEAVAAQHLDLLAATELGHLVVEQARVGRMDLEQLELVLRAQQRLADPG